MSKSSQPARIRRITLAVDTSLRVLGALELAASLAARSQASLEALFVEDIDLLTLAALPFARELDTVCGTERELDEPNVESSLRGHRDRVRKALERAGRESSLRTSVRVKRGRYLPEALAAANAVDVVFLSAIRRIRIGNTVGHRLSRAGQFVWVLYDGSAASERTLQLAMEIGEAQGAQPGFLILAGSEDEITRLSDRVRSTLRENGFPEVACVALRNASDLKVTLAAKACSLLLLPRERSDLLTDPCGELWESLDCTLILVS